MADCEIQERDEPPRTVAGIRRRVRPDQIGAALGEMLPAVSGFLAGAGVAPASAPVVLYHEHDEEAGVFDLEGGFFLPPGVVLASAGEVRVWPLPGAPAIIALHRGPYERLGDTHAVLGRWADEHGRVAAPPCYDHYLSDPGAVASPQELVTEVVWRLLPMVD